MKPAPFNTRRFLSVSVLLILSLCLGYPQSTSAHASLLKATPAAGSHLDNPPKQIKLTFNERIGTDLYVLKVYDDSGEKVTDRKAKLGQKHRKLALKLRTKLNDGIYTVSYKVISADGHPVNGSYTFSVGHVEKIASAGSDTNGNAHSHNHGASLYFIKIGYYILLLFLAGWVLWGAVFPMNGPGIRTKYQSVATFLKSFYLFILLGWSFVKVSGILGEIGWAKAPSVLLSAMGIGLAASIVLAVASLWIVGRSKWIDFVWAALLLLAEAINGHAAAFPPVILSIAVDFIHLVTSAIWAGGLLYLIYFW
ncbi:MAG TPA: copper resistance protein CopC, partial [Bacillales bacterium]|nr:copper resistance protein CopC [Bacillales bacterium]